MNVFRKTVLASSLLVAALVIGPAPSIAAAPLSPNASILFYGNGHAMTGTLKLGVFRQKRTFDTGTWTAAAVSRDSLALYNKHSGKVKTGTFRGGVFTPKHTTTISTGYTQMTASCDTVLFYRKSDGRTLIATLVDGTLANKQVANLSAGWVTVVASCDTLYLQDPAASGGDGFWEAGILEGGIYTDRRAHAFQNGWLMAASADSYIQVEQGGGGGVWGTLVDGRWTPSGNVQSGFGVWDTVAATGNSVAFYSRDGIAAWGSLTGGNYSYAGVDTDFGANWKIIAGGK